LNFINLFFQFCRPSSASKKTEPNPFADWLPEKSWLEIQRATNELEPFRGLAGHVKANPEPWRKFYDSGNPHECDFPEAWNEMR
jgi:hypothetical protein